MSDKTKTCSRCKKLLPIKQFSWRNKTKGKLRGHCKECQNIYTKQHYVKNREKYIKRSLKRKKRIIKENRGKIFEYLENNPCVDCGELDILYLEFDHKKGKNKKMAVADMISYSWATIMEEINKCEVRCVKCHRLKTAEQFNWKKLERSKR